MTGVMKRIVEWVEGQPEWARPILYSSMIVPAFAIRRGGVIIIPLAVVYSIYASSSVLSLLATLVGVFGIAIGGAALGGASYSFVGRHARHVPIIGPYLTGIISIAPYIAALTLLLRLKESVSLTASISPLELATFGAGTMLFGLLIGFMWFRD
jgi:hypothetical protein